MCGLVGYISTQPQTTNVIENMLAPIFKRGPDDYGVWTDQTNRTVFGHRRLSILDLSEAGHQPMQSHSGRYIIAYNGEIYNSQELKADLPQQPNWRGHSDTEIILAYIDAFGIATALPKFEGMFAFALYDQHTHELILARDQAGIKPLYYGFVGNDLMFGSQLNSFLSYPGFQKKINHESMSLYFKYNYIPAPYAIYQNCNKVPAGTFITFKDGHKKNESRYWSLANSFASGLKNPYTNYDQSLSHLHHLLEKSVKDQLMADVPVGVFLSGGIDSSLIAALARPHVKNLKTFSIGFDEERYNEAPFAKEVAIHFNTEHHEKIVTFKEAQEIIPLITTIYDEPFADASQIPTYILSKFTQEHVKVALSGDGGDELFGGYSRYVDMLKLRKLQKIIPASIINKLSNSPIIRTLLGPNLAFKLHIAHSCLQHQKIEDQYDALYNFWRILSKNSPSLSPSKASSSQSDLSYMCFHDASLYMQDDILTKVDRATMATSLEARVPFLSHPIIETACRVPSNWHSDGKQTKLFLKNILRQHLPSKLIDRPKKGFALPIDIWLKGPLKSWAHGLIHDIKRDGFLPIGDIEKVMYEHEKNLVNWQYSLWNVLMWQNWKNNNDASY